MLRVFTYKDASMALDWLLFLHCPLICISLGESLTQKQVVVLSYPRYCRYRSVVARLRKQPSSLLSNQVVLALGGIAVFSENLHILYCRDTFEHPTLLHNDSVCDEFGEWHIRQQRYWHTNMMLRIYTHSQTVGFYHCSTVTHLPGTTVKRNATRYIEA